MNTPKEIYVVSYCGENEVFFNRDHAREWRDQLYEGAALFFPYLFKLDLDKDGYYTGLVQNEDGHTQKQTYALTVDGTLEYLC